MSAFITFFLLSGIVSFIFINREKLARRGEERFRSKDPNYTPRLEDRFFTNGPRMPKKPRKNHLYQVSAPVTPRFNFENAHCEICSAPPRCQYKNEKIGLVLEFCGHHARKKEAGLLNSNFVKTVDLS